MEAQLPFAVHVIFTSAQEKFASLCAWLETHAQRDTMHDAIEMRVLSNRPEVGVMFPPSVHGTHADGGHPCRNHHPQLSPRS